MPTESRNFTPVDDTATTTAVPELVSTRAPSVSSVRPLFTQNSSPRKLVTQV
ncbi:hypothetical protein MMCCUG48898_4925 [Mycobacteroides abscessus subsp. massiliense CCUG 48898 = JCM 15300]|nr:hypothetical protein MMCCUG48898_4925 [Mycobacteroides abscessus subsp. massiliense CCUG 48898 = JCM 15300]